MLGLSVVKMDLKQLQQSHARLTVFTALLWIMLAKNRKKRKKNENNNYKSW